MVTSASTPGSILMEVICLSILEGLCKSMSRLWILNWKRPQVLEPSPQGVFLVVILRGLVGIRTGPFTLRLFFFAPLIRLAQTFSKDFTLRLVRIILIRWIPTSGSTGVFLVSLKAKAAVRLPDRLVQREWTAVSQGSGQSGAPLQRRRAIVSSLKSQFCFLFFGFLGPHRFEGKLKSMWKWDPSSKADCPAGGWCHLHL